MDPFQQALKALEELEDTLLESVALAFSDVPLRTVAESEALFSSEEVEEFAAAFDVAVFEE